MAKRFEQPKIWIDVTCGNCGVTTGFYYRNPDSIRRMKENTRLWRYDNELGINLCENCLTKIGGNKT